MDMHIIVSPVRSHVLHPGNFDGFPTGAALNAVLNGCVLITTDPHDNAEKLGLKDGRDLFLTSDRPSEIIQLINRLFYDRELLDKVGKNGYARFFEITNFKAQMLEKFNILNGIIKK
jgi:lipopolysaccharide transport system ATP-binding protein